MKQVTNVSTKELCVLECVEEYSGRYSRAVVQMPQHLCDEHKELRKKFNALSLKRCKADLNPGDCPDEEKALEDLETFERRFTKGNGSDVSTLASGEPCYQLFLPQFSFVHDL